MGIPKTIYQTYKTAKLPLITKLHIYRMKKNNPDYDYQFYDDSRIAAFIKKEYGNDIYDLYDKLFIGAAKADFFRYAILYKLGGIYLDIDSLFLGKLDDFILPEDNAIISLEKSKEYYIQFALFFEANHPILKKTLDIVMKNIEENKYPYDVHKMTGPSAFTQAVEEFNRETSKANYRQVGVDYDYFVKFSYRMSKTFLYGFFRKNHWRRISKKHAVLKSSWILNHHW